jgi:hypothetical protein
VISVAGKQAIKGATCDNKNPGVLSATMPDMKLNPGEDRLVEYSYVLLADRDHYHDFATAIPLIGLSLVVENEVEELEVHATNGFGCVQESQALHWAYKSILMAGDRITVRWFPKNEPMA